MPYPGLSPGEVAELLNKGERLSKPRNSLEPLADYIDFTEFYTKNLNA